MHRATALVKETSRRIRAARGYRDAHNKRACLVAGETALAPYESPSDAEHHKAPLVPRV